MSCVIVYFFVLKTTFLSHMLVYLMLYVTLLNCVSAVTHVMTVLVRAQSRHACISTVDALAMPTRPECVKPSGKTCHISAVCHS